jgi:hypothetical protein
MGKTAITAQPAVLATDLLFHLLPTKYSTTMAQVLLLFDVFNHHPCIHRSFSIQLCSLPLWFTMFLLQLTRWSWVLDDCDGYDVDAPLRSKIAFLWVHGCSEILIVNNCKVDFKRTRHLLVARIIYS